MSRHPLLLAIRVCCDLTSQQAGLQDKSWPSCCLCKQLHCRTAVAECCLIAAPVFQFVKQGTVHHASRSERKGLSSGRNNMQVDHMATAVTHAILSKLGKCLKRDLLLIADMTSSNLLRIRCLLLYFTDPCVIPAKCTKLRLTTPYHT